MQHGESVVGPKASSLGRHDLIQLPITWLRLHIRADPRILYYLPHPPFGDHEAQRDIQHACASTKECANFSTGAPTSGTKAHTEMTARGKAMKCSRGGGWQGSARRQQSTAEQTTGGRDFVYADSPGEASLKPTTRPIS